MWYELNKFYNVNLNDRLCTEDHKCHRYEALNTIPAINKGCQPCAKEIWIWSESDDLKGLTASMPASGIDMSYKTAQQCKSTKVPKKVYPIFPYIFIMVKLREAFWRKVLNVPLRLDLKVTGYLNDLL